MEERRLNHKRGLWILLGISFVLVILYWFAMWLWYHDWKQGADFGNAFGAANALFSGLALAAVVFAIFLQHDELLLTHKDLRHSVEAQERAEASLRKTMELEVVMKLFETFRESRERNRDYSGPELSWSWDSFNSKYPTEREKRKSHEWRYLTDYGGFFELCGILIRQGYLSDSLVKMLPRATPLWIEAQEIIQGMRNGMGKGLWGNWEYFAKRQHELIQSPLEDA